MVNINNTKAKEKPAIVLRRERIVKVQQHDGSIIEMEKTSAEAFEVLNHSTSHLLAQAITELYPKALFGFGPAIEEGFYYDIDFGDDVITENDLPIIEKKMKELASKDLRIVREELTKEQALEVFKNNPYKIELIEGITEDITTFKQGDFVDLCRGPHIMSTGLIKHFKLLSLAGAYFLANSVSNASRGYQYGENHDESETITFVQGKKGHESTIEVPIPSGYKKTKYRSHGQPVYSNGKDFITPDVDGHNGGVWKKATSVKGLQQKDTRLGTYDANLIKIHD